MTEEDLESYSNVLHMLEPTADLLELLRTYEGCGEYIRQVRPQWPAFSSSLLSLPLAADLFRFWLDSREKGMEPK